MTDPKPRDIAARQLDAMMRAAGEVWEQEAPKIDEQRRAEYKRLCWRHIIAYFAREASRR